MNHDPRFPPAGIPQMPVYTDAQGNPLPWAPGNPGYDAFYGAAGQGYTINPRNHDMRLPRHYGEHGMEQPAHPPQVELVRRSVTEPSVIASLREQGLIPRRSSGTRGQAIIDQDAIMADIEYAFAKNLIGYASVDNPDLFQLPFNAPPAGPTISPLAVAPEIPAGGLPFGACIALAELRFGHDGTNQTVLFDLPPGAIVKVPIAGSAAKLYGRLAPKYYRADDNNLVPNKRVYLPFPGAPAALTNQQFNMLPDLLALNGFVNTNPAFFQGFFGDGSVANGDEFAKPTRRFYGTVLTGAAALHQNTICPVAWCAVAMQVTGGLGPTVATPVATTLQFNQNGPPGSVNAGPFPLNTIVPIINNCQSIEVFQNAAAAAGNEIPFEIIFYLSF